MFYERFLRPLKLKWLLNPELRIYTIDTEQENLFVFRLHGQKLIIRIFLVFVYLVEIFIRWKWANLAPVWVFL